MVAGRYANDAYNYINLYSAKTDSSTGKKQTEQYKQKESSKNTVIDCILY